MTTPMEGTLPPSSPGSPVPHHASFLLVLGIAGLACSCLPLGILVWVLAQKDLQLMDRGEVDQSGRGMTQAAKVLGIVEVALLAIVLLSWLLIWLVRGTFAPHLS